MDDLESAWALRPGTVQHIRPDGEASWVLNTKLEVKNTKPYTRGQLTLEQDIVS